MDVKITVRKPEHAVEGLKKLDFLSERDRRALARLAAESPRMIIHVIEHLPQGEVFKVVMRHYESWTYADALKLLQRLPPGPPYHAPRKPLLNKALRNLTRWLDNSKYSEYLTRDILEPKELDRLVDAVHRSKNQRLARHLRDLEKVSGGLLLSPEQRAKLEKLAKPKMALVKK